MIRKIYLAAVSKSVCLAALLMAGAVFATTAKAVTGPYFGQTPPGTTPTMFAQGIISLTNRAEARIVFSPDGTESFYSVSNSDWSNPQILYTQCVNNVWTTPVVASFTTSLSLGCYEPFFSADGNKV